MTVTANAFNLFTDAIDAIFKLPETIREKQINSFLTRIGDGKNFEIVRSELSEAASPTYRGADAFPTNAELYATLTPEEKENLKNYFWQNVKEAFAEFPNLKQKFPQIKI